MLIPGISSKYLPSVALNRVLTQSIRRVRESWISCMHCFSVCVCPSLQSNVIEAWGLLLMVANSQFRYVCMDHITEGNYSHIRSRASGPSIRRYG
jgi:hypothetical protein